MDRKKALVKLLLTHFIITMCGELSAVGVTILLSEEAKVKTVIMTSIVILVSITIVMLVLNIIFVSGFIKIFSHDFSGESLNDTILRCIQLYSKKLYITSIIIFGFAPLLYMFVQTFIKGIPSSIGSVAVGNFCLVGIGIITGNLYYIYLYPMLIAILRDLKKSYSRIKLKHKIMLPIINMLLILLIILSLYSYKAALALFRPPNQKNNFANFKINIERINEEYLNNTEEDKASFYTSRIKSKKILYSEFYFFIDGGGTITDSNFKDIVGKNALKDIQKDWRTTDYFVENVELLLKGNEGMCDIFYNRQIYYSFYYHIPETDVYILSGELSNAFFYPTNQFAVIIVTIGIVFIVFITIYSLMTATKKFKTFDEVSNFLNTLGSGNVSVTRMPGSYEIGDEISDMVKSVESLAFIFKTVSINLKGASVDLNQIAETVKVTSRVISDDSQTQASSIEEFSASVEEITSSIELISENIKKQYDRTQNVFEVIKQFTESMMEISKMTEEAEQVAEVAYLNVTEIEKNLETTVVGIKAIGDSSKNVAETLSIIQDISDQINLLSLNASIEAARAGDAGRGFAVVADEVGKLADKTSTEAKEIEKQVNDSNKKVQEGIDFITNISESIQKMITSVRNTSDIIIGIAFHSKSFVETTDTVYKIVKDLTEISNENSVAANEQLHTAKEVLGSIDHMNDVVQKTVESINQFVAVIEKVNEHSQKISNILQNIRTE